MPLQVVGEGFHRTIPACRFFAQSHQDDRVYIPGETLAEAGGIALADSAHFVRRDLASAARFRGGDHLAGTGRLHLGNHPRHFVHGRAQQPVGPVSGEQFVEHDSERINVRESGDRRPIHLLGAGVLGRHHPGQRHGIGRLPSIPGRQNLGNAKVKQLHPAIVSDQDITRLQIPMHHQMLVSVTNRVDDAAKQFNALADVEFPLVAPAMNRLAVNELHHEVRPSLFRHAGVEQLGNIGMIQQSENFTLLLEPGDDEGRVGRGQNQLDGGLPVERFVGSLGEIDAAHATAPDLANEGVATEVAAFQLGRGERLGGSGCWPVEPSGDVVASLQQTLNLLANFRLALTLPIQVRIPGVTGPRRGLLVDFPDPAEFFGCHHNVSPMSLARSAWKIAHN